MAVLSDSRPLRRAVVALAVVLGIFLVMRTILTIRQIDEVGEPVPTVNSVTVSGQARLKLAPDLATLHVGVQSKGATVAAAQQDNTTKMNDILAKIKAIGIDGNRNLLRRHLYLP